MTCKRLSLAPVLFALSASLSAATITVQWDSPPFDPAGTNVGTIYYPVNHSVNAGAGRFEGTVTGSSGFDTSLLYEDESDFFAYCFDLAQTLQSGATYTVAPLASAVVVPGADAAVLDFLGAVNAHFGGDAYRWLKPVNSTESAAIQLGIWEALYNDDFVLTTGGVHFGNVPVAVASLFNTISAARATSPDLSGNLVMVLTHDRRQDVITGARQVRLLPEPGSLLLFGAAAAAAAIARRRRR